MKKYSKYKASGVVWLGEIPSDWNRYRIKFCFNSINVTDKANLSDLSEINS